MRDELVGSLGQAIENIHRYRTELREEPRLRARMKQVHAWYAVRSNDGTWIFAPSKFVGYAKNTAQDHLSKQESRKGGRTEKLLRDWFETVAPETRRGKELDSALREFPRQPPARIGSCPSRDVRFLVDAQLPPGLARLVGFARLSSICRPSLQIWRQGKL